MLYYILQNNRVKALELLLEASKLYLQRLSWKHQNCLYNVGEIGIEDDKMIFADVIIYFSLWCICKSFSPVTESNVEEKTKSSYG